MLRDVACCVDTESPVSVEVKGGKVLLRELEDVGTVKELQRGSTVRRVDTEPAVSVEVDEGGVGRGGEAGG